MSLTSPLIDRDFSTTDLLVHRQLPSLSLTCLGIDPKISAQ